MQMDRITWDENMQARCLARLDKINIGSTASRNYLRHSTNLPPSFAFSVSHENSEIAASQEDTGWKEFIKAITKAL